MILTGLTVFLATSFLLLKLPRKAMLKALKHDVALDLAVSAITMTIHWGTFSGVMAATFAGLLMSLATSAMRRLVGYIDNNYYYPGLINLKL